MTGSSRAPGSPGSAGSAGSVAAHPAGAPPSEALPGSLLLEVVAAVISSGLPPSAAVTAVGFALAETGDPRGEALMQVAPQLGLPSDRPGASSVRPGTPSDLSGVEELAEALDLAVRAGVAPAAMVRGAAVMLRRRQAVAQQRAIRRLEIWLVAPAGLCWLPAFVLVGVVPLVIDLLRG